VSGTATGFLLVQVSNVCFAFGQVRYRDLTSRLAGVRDHEVFALLYVGACIVSSVPLLALAPSGLPGLTGKQLIVLGYLGMVPAGVGFFLWNVGARKVNAGTLAAMNNAKIPLAVLVSIALFGERPDIWPLLAGGAAILSAVWFNERYTRTVIVEHATKT
jgi:drug/metabolite transporter (DMT)-like permease